MIEAAELERISKQVFDAARDSYYEEAVFEVLHATAKEAAESALGAEGFEVDEVSKDDRELLYTAFKDGFYEAVHVEERRDMLAVASGELSGSEACEAAQALVKKFSEQAPHHTDPFNIYASAREFKPSTGTAVLRPTA